MSGIRRLARRLAYGRVSLHGLGRSLQRGKDVEVPFFNVGRLVIFVDTKE